MNMFSKPFLLLVCACCAFLAATEKISAKTGMIFIAARKAIHAADMDMNTGTLTNLRVAADIAGPQFIVIDPKQRFLFTLNTTTADGVRTGMVSAFSIASKTGKLTLLNQQPTRGAGPTHLDVDNGCKTILVANYGGGSVAAFGVDKDGALATASSFIQHEGSGPNAQRQQGPHAHCINIDPANRFALSCDLGADKVFVYKLDSAKSTLAPNDPPFASLKPGAGPRHLAFHPSGRFVYVINELDSTMTGFGYDAKQGVLKEIEAVSTLPADFTGRNFPAEVAVHPGGKFLYGSNRGHDSIVVFGINKNTGRLVPVQHQSTGGKTPRHFEIEPTGKFLLAANQESGSIIVFRIDSATGRLSSTGSALEIEGPSCIKCFFPTAVSNR